MTFKPEPRLTEYLEKEIELNEIDLYGAVANQNSTDNRVLKIQASSNKADEYKAEGQKIYDSIPEGEVIAVRVGTNAPHSVGRAAEANDFFTKSDQIEDRVRRNMQVVAQSLGPSLIGTTDEQVWTRNVRLRAELEALYKRHPYYYYESQGEITTRAQENLVLGCLSLLLAWFNYHLLRELGFWNYVAVRYVRLVKKKFV